MTDAAPPSVARVALTALTLTDFRNYAALPVAFDGRSVVLVGANGSGKTNLLEAVSFLSPGRGLRRATYDAVARVGGSGGWTVHVGLESRGARVAIGTGLQPEPGAPRARRIRIDGEDAGTSDALLSHLDVLWLTPAMDGLFTGPAGDRRRFVDRLAMGLDAAHGPRASSYEKAVRHRNRLLEDPSADAAWLDAIETEIARHGAGMTFILTQYGKPFSAAGFTSWFVERAVLAGVHGRTPHGLRKAAGRRLAEAGATTKEIAAVLGHTSLDEVETYTRSADQAKLADTAIAKLEKAEKRTPRVKP